MMQLIKLSDQPKPERIWAGSPVYDPRPDFITN